MLYYIFILHQTTTGKLQERISQCCIISSFYIKPQLVESALRLRRSCIISSFYIKPQHIGKSDIIPTGCIISSFYIKPQLNSNGGLSIYVVLYLHSTSNHNRRLLKSRRGAVVLYLHSTSNHNFHLQVLAVNRVVLYLHSTSNHNIYHLHY